MDLISKSISGTNMLLPVQQYLSGVLLAYKLSFGWLTWKDGTYSTNKSTAT